MSRPAHPPLPGPRLPSAAGLGLALALTGLAVAQSENISPPPPVIQVAPALIFFPPIPPPLDRPAARAAPIPARLGAPPELVRDLNEFFYPQLASRLTSSEKFPDRLRTRVDDYHAAKAAALRDLREELNRLRPLEPTERLAGFEALARRQAPALARLAEDAEKLRRDLLEADRNWSAFRDWHLSDKQSRGFSPIEIAQVMRAYAFYQNNLLPAQRRLLMEIAIELSVAAENSTKAARAQPYLFLPPEPARVLLPDDLSPEVAAAVAAYQTKKSALKKELYDGVTAHDGSSLAIFRPGLRGLTEKQAPQLAELDRLAEQIRRGLVQTPVARAEERSPLPPALSVRIAQFLRDRDAAQADAAARIDAIALRNPMVRVNYQFEETGLKFTAIPGRGGRGGPRGPAPGESISQVNAALTAVADDYNRKLTGLAAEAEAIHQEANATLGNPGQARVNAALNSAARAVQQQDKADAFADYRTAVFEPGLSIEQRCLLFESALQRLDLPLPRGDLQPTRRSSTW